MRYFVTLVAFLGVWSSLLHADAPVGRRKLRIHDPSTFIRDADGTWWLFATGVKVVAARSTDLSTWTYHDPVLPVAPAWAREVAPGNKNHHYWAPDVIRVGDLYHLYYSVSEFGKNTSAIALATSRALDPSAKDYGWTDRGIVIRSGPGKDFNAIDPALLIDDGRLWMAFGSFWGGIFLVELDPATGLLRDPATPPRRVAWSREIEAPTLYRRGEYIYLFVNEGLCCRGKDSTYRVRVGRSRSITGPYLDDQGRDLLEAGGREVIATEGDFIGPGHIGLLKDGETEWASMHFYDGTRDGAPYLALRQLGWTVDGWPEIRD
ncbi:MAG: arabinan endo-1,5-alpha-L-arabinosidase [Opitutaceae bacterium]|jgi:arabinan endo-1,5-alpha-L-arabinosidase|nr:arabinan endo-1,5-alpha-L-arabinosidase [Opitutaceae bacterium]